MTHYSASLLLRTYCSLTCLLTYLLTYLLNNSTCRLPVVQDLAHCPVEVRGEVTARHGPVDEGSVGDVAAQVVLRRLYIRGTHSRCIAVGST